MHQLNRMHIPLNDSSFSDESPFINHEISCFIFFPFFTFNKFNNFNKFKTIPKIKQKFTSSIPTNHGLSFLKIIAPIILFPTQPNLFLSLQKKTKLNGNSSKIHFCDKFRKILQLTFFRNEFLQLCNQNAYANLNKYAYAMYQLRQKQWLVKFPKYSGFNFHRSLP